VRAGIFTTYVAVYAVLNAAGLLLLRTSLGSGSQRPRAWLGGALGDPRFLVGAILYGLGFLMWLGTLTRYQLSIVYPVFVGVGYCTVLLASFVFLHEHASPSKIVGISLVALGLVFVVR
jgi:multidrug transporter EmrE-like cation transporter